MTNAVELFAEAMKIIGLDPADTPIADGTFRRFQDRQDKAGKKNGWYILHGDDLPAGMFGHWSLLPDGQKWQARHDNSLTPQEKIRIKERIEQSRAARDKEREEIRAACRDKAERMLAESGDVSADHAYVVKKNIKPFGARQLQDMLLIPVRKKKTLTGLQIIMPDGSKKFLTGTEKAGAYLVINGKGKTVYLVEGWATGCTVHELTGSTVIICYDCGNLAAVANEIMERGRDYDMVLVADNDRLTAGNPGLTKATVAALATSARLAIPTFPGNEGTDANDLAAISGPAAVLACLEAAKAVDPIPTSAPDIEATSTEQPGAQWPEPHPLPEGLPPVKQLDPAMIPAPFRGWLVDIAHRMQAPIDFAAAAAIVALGSLIGRGCGIYPKRHDNWLVVPNLWGGVVGDPSVMKTPTVSEGMKPLVRLEIEAQRQHNQEMEAFAIDNQVVEIQTKAICANIKKVVSKDPSADVSKLREELTKLKRDEPVRRRYQTQDATVEKLGELLNQNPRGVLTSRDELIGWMRTMEKAGHESDRGFNLESWNGTGRFTYDRIGRGTLDIEAACQSVFGAITPGPLADYIRQAVKGGGGNDGLMQRFQMLVYPDTTAEWVNIDRYPNAEQKNRAYEIFRALSEEIPGAIQEDDESIPALRFTPTGQEIFDTWRHDLEMRLREGRSLHPVMVSHLAKYRSLMPSLALIFHLIEVADGTAEPGPVSEQSTIMAAAWCDYLESHAGRVYSGAMLPGMEAAREIVKHIKLGDVKDGCKPKDIYRPQWSRLTTADEVRSGLEILIEYDWLTMEKINTGGRPSDIVRLNPKITLF